MTDSFRLGIAGLGTVGCGVVKIVQTQAPLLQSRIGRPVQITAVSARSKAKDRGIDLSAYAWEDDPVGLARRDDVDCVVELIGGEAGAAKELIETALQNGKHVITANKALLAHHGAALAELAEQHNVTLAYEAAVAGGIPVIKALREGFTGNAVQGVYGILNGTCNYILSVMKDTGRDFDDVLAEAQAKGYAETPPDLDIDGFDAAHKLCLLGALAFGIRPDFEALHVEGIRNVTATDISYAEELGYKIKLLGIARRTEDGKILQVMEPCLVPASHTLGTVDNVLNAVFVEGDQVGNAILIGRGAGGGPTASAVLSDITDLARGERRAVFGVPAAALQVPDYADPDRLCSRFYLRLSVIDKPGVVADVSAILRDRNISIESFIQRGRDPGNTVPLVIVTHECRQSDIRAACQDIGALPVVAEPPHKLRIEDF